MGWFPTTAAREKPKLGEIPNHRPPDGALPCLNITLQTETGLLQTAEEMCAPLQCRGPCPGRHGCRGTCFRGAARPGRGCVKVELVLTSGQVPVGGKGTFQQPLPSPWGIWVWGAFPQGTPGSGEQHSSSGHVTDGVRRVRRVCKTVCKCV